LIAKAADADYLAEQVHDYARPHLRSRDVEVALDLTECKGSIIVGFHSGGSFTIAEQA
jgi:hypothetical protein